MQRMMDIVWVFVDLVFPCPQPRSKDEVAKEEKQRANQEIADDRLVDGLPEKKDDLTTYLASVQELLHREQERRQGVDGRLTTIVGLSSIAGTIVIGTIITPRPLRGAVGLLVILALFYLVLQLCSAIIGAVIGLGRRGYRASMAEDVLPAGEAQTVHLRRQIRSCVATLADHRSLNNGKVTMMAVAHRAMLNFLGGLLLLALFGIVQAVTIKPTDELVHRLREDHELRELLRGPVGHPGPRGEAGPPGPPGTPCTTSLPNMAAPMP